MHQWGVLGSVIFSLCESIINILNLSFPKTFSRIDTRSPDPMRHSGKLTSGSGNLKAGCHKSCRFPGACCTDRQVTPPKPLKPAGSPHSRRNHLHISIDHIFLRYFQAHTYPIPKNIHQPLSENMSDPTPEQRKLVNEYVIVFDNARSTITTEKAEKYKGREYSHWTEQYCLTDFDRLRSRSYRKPEEDPQDCPKAGQYRRYYPQRAFGCSSRPSCSGSGDEHETGLGQMQPDCCFILAGF